jgi:hypothetical protein
MGAALSDAAQCIGDLSEWIFAGFKQGFENARILDFSLQAVERAPSSGESVHKPDRSEEFLSLLAIGSTNVCCHKRIGAG